MSFVQPGQSPHLSPSQILSLTAPPTPSQPAPSSPDPTAYILSINPLANSPSLLLTHATSNLTVVDRSSFQVVDKWIAPNGSGEISGVVGQHGAEGLVWTCGKEGGILGWDSRVKGGKATNKVMRVPGGKTVPLLSLASSAEHHLLAAGTELTNHEALIAYWDPRSPSQPLYTHSTLHSDDITTLSFAPSSLHSLTFPLQPSTDPDIPPPAQPQSSAILLSGSTDGLLALSNALEKDEDESTLGVGNGEASVAAAGWEENGGWGVWMRNDMDGVERWDASDFTLRSKAESLRLDTPEGVPSTQAWTTDYLIDVVPSLSTASSSRIGGCLVGDNAGNIALFNASNGDDEDMVISKTFRGGFRGHRDVVRAAYYDSSSQTMYTGSEDSVLCSWSLNDTSGKDEDEDVEMDKHAQVDGDDEMNGVKRRRPDEPMLGGDGGWGKRGRR
ncbi:WD40 repeat protein [Phaffia rhodozyma]|uniref:WD40 repeat protein n=1 Tax=Phaffia rhodozyma TaxID=264483 RepID=A0A0F7SIB5_PHARH|nr:WD40 repeat protein [Phaffia rhodozyma]